MELQYVLYVLAYIAFSPFSFQLKSGDSIEVTSLYFNYECAYAPNTNYVQIFRNTESRIRVISTIEFFSNLQLASVDSTLIFTG